MNRREPAVYIITNQPKGTLYIGVTSNLPSRIWNHKQRTVEGFAKRYGLDQLVWYEYHDEMEQAILREKRLKKWERPWKLRLVHESNPEWRDLFEDLA